jgi:hypothetical protein
MTPSISRQSGPANAPDASSRREFLHSLCAAASLPLAAGLTVHTLAAEGARGAIDLGSRRELFVDDFLIERLSGAELKLHKPLPREVVFVCDAPWEGRHSGYFTLFADDGHFRAYYRGWDYTEKRTPFACCARSEDGIRWVRPDYGLIEHAGSRTNNIVMSGPNEGATHNLTPFKDGKPTCDTASRYKAFGRNKQKAGSYLDAFRSPDGLRWEQIGDQPVTGRGAFDSQNVAFWDAEHGHYRAYWRPGGKGVRSIATSVSSDFVHWEDETPLVYEHHTAQEHLYTCTVQPYARAPHLFLGFPTRFLPDPSVGNEATRDNAGTTEPVFMSSRDGVKFRRWAEPVIPQTAPQDRMGNRANYMTLGVLQLPGDDRELSVYATEAGYDLGPTRLRRFTYRTDGFVSASAPAKGELLTRPLRFDGKSLEINGRTSPGGFLQVEVCNEAGRALPGFEASQCVPLTGDEITWTVKWKGHPGLSARSGRPIRLRFLLQDADLFAMKFNV